MEVENELFYILVPVESRPVAPGVEILPVQEFLQDEPACRALWQLLDTQFRTRSKFLSIWPGVRFVAVHRTGENVTGLLLISAMINWQIDYVVVRPDARRRGIAAALVNTAVSRAFELNVPYVMLTSREGLRPLYEGECGFRVVDQRCHEPVAAVSDSVPKKG
jgi:ribosomal protein S18 acetylase RimI-like enzyme